MIHQLRDLFPESIFYVTPDVKRGIGLEGVLPNYHIICSYLDPLIFILRSQGANIFCLEEHDSVKEINNSGRLLEHPAVEAYIKEHSNDSPHIAFFKPSLKLEILCKEKNYIPLGNTAALNSTYEDKLKFFTFTQANLPDHHIPGEVGIMGQLEFSSITDKLGSPFVVQFSKGWAGKTTFIISKEEQFQQLNEKFPQTRVRVLKYIQGFSILNNACIYNDQILISPPAIQLSNIPALHPNPSVTCGRQWPARFITDSQSQAITSITQTIGKAMKESGYKGYFGLDFIIENITGTVYLTENNARCTASSAFYTTLELGMESTPLLACHFAAFLNKEIPVSVATSVLGTQMILRDVRISPILFGDYGVYEKNNRALLRDGEYSPSTLASNEFIFMRRRKKYNTDEEVARMEMKSEILDSPHELNGWIKKIIV